MLSFADHSEKCDQLVLQVILKIISERYKIPIHTAYLTFYRTGTGYSFMTGKLPQDWFPEYYVTLMEQELEGSGTTVDELASL